MNNKIRQRNKLDRVDEHYEDWHSTITENNKYTLEGYFEAELDRLQRHIDGAESHADALIAQAKQDTVKAIKNDVLNVVL